MIVADSDGDSGVLARIVVARRSVRAFRPEPVPMELIRRVFEIAGHSPSNCNCQPWITHVVSGEALARLRARLVEAASAREPCPDIPITRDYVAPYRERRIDAAARLFEATGVGRHDAAARTASMLRNYRFFDAPHAAFFCMERNFTEREAADLGMYVQTLLLAMQANGIGSCAQGSLSYYPDILRDELGLGENLVCLFGLSFGYPDNDDPSSSVVPPRAPLAENVFFHE